MDTEFDYFGDQADMELEQIIEGRADNVEEEDDDNGERGDDEAIEAPGPKKKTDGDEEKKKRVLAPRPKLDPKRLSSDRGLLALEGEMRNVKLKGRGHELADYDLVMGKLQHWAHRLFPSYTFDDCLDKLEKLGSKKVVNIQMKRIRMGLTSIDDVVDTTVRGDDYVEDDQPTSRLTQADPDAAFNDLLATVQPAAASTPAPKPDQPSNGLTEEQKARILRNRLAAEERRLARLKEQKEQEQLKKEEEEALAALANLEEEGM